MPVRKSKSIIVRSRVGVRAQMTACRDPAMKAHIGIVSHIAKIAMTDRPPTAAVARLKVGICNARASDVILASASAGIG